MLLKGGCQCGGVRYEVSPRNDEAYFCHCRMCQRAFGNVFATFFNVDKDKVTWTAGAPSYYDSSAIARRGFCGNCGTPLSFEYHKSPRLDLSVGSLDEPNALTPKRHCGIESRLSHFTWKDELPTEETTLPSL